MQSFQTLVCGYKAMHIFYRFELYPKDNKEAQWVSTGVAVSGKITHVRKFQLGVPLYIMGCILSHVGVVIVRRVLDWMIGLIDTLYTQLVTTINYSAIAVLHILQITRTRCIFSFVTSRILTTDL
jgi:hypothetical protein